jgi:peptidoglycan/xylan/chitin deacetylase (PgdA/CDA1 family)
LRVLASKSKRWLKKALVQSSMLEMARPLCPASAVILSYHSVVEDPQLTSQILGISQSRATFEAHMETVAQHFSPVTVEDVAEFARTGRRLPPRAVAVTFDDGFADNCTVALPILNQYAIPSTFYIMVNAVSTGTLPWYCRLRFALSTTSKPEWKNSEGGRTYPLASPEQRKAALQAAWEIGARMTGEVQQEFVGAVEESLQTEPGGSRQRYMMTWEQVRALRKAGHTVGGHTISHPNVAQVSVGEARSEIIGCKKRLEEEFGERIDHFSYPHPALNPQWSMQTLEITREAGFKSAALTTCGPVHAGDEPLALKRIYAANDLNEFTWNLQSTFLGRSI